MEKKHTHYERQKVREAYCSISPEVSACVGCNACEIVCALVHEGKADLCSGAFF